MNDGWDDDTACYQQELDERRRREEEADQKLEDLKRQQIEQMWKWIDSLRDEPCKA